LPRTAPPQERAATARAHRRRAQGGPAGPGRGGAESPEGSLPLATPPPAFHRLTAAEACAHLGVDPARGLTSAEAARRLAQWGPNRLAAAQGTPVWRSLAAQFQDLMVLVLLGAAGISFFLGEVADGVVVLVVVVVNAILGFIQETRAERSLDALRRLSAPSATVRRDGHTVTIPAEAVVPGDILVLEAGDRVAADARILELASLATEEAAITGESRPVSKSGASQAAAADLPSGADVAPGDRRNVVFQGSHVVRGRATAAVFATGMHTEVGRIAGLIADAGEGRTPLQRRLDDLGRWLVAVCVAISAAVVVTGVLQGEPPYRMFLAGVSLAVAAIPEGLPAIVTIALALGVQRMIARRAIVRHLPAVETLGCATVICSDKTGTLTRNAMAVQALYAGGRRYAVAAGALRAEGEATPPSGHRPTAAAPRPALAAAARVAVLCNNAPLEPPPAARGTADPTEVALLQLAELVGLDAAALRARTPRVGEIPFDAERRRMTVVCQGADTGLVLVKGALEEVLARCSWVRLDQGRVVLDARWTAAIRQQGEAMAGSALRVLALAERPWPPVPGHGDPPAADQPAAFDLPPAPTPPPAPAADEVERDLTFCGLVGLMDPPRPEVPAAIRRCRQAGVRPVMITGDHAATARAVATAIDLLPPGGRVLTGSELAAMSERELLAAVDEVAVYARVSPADKLRVVRALRTRGHVVAMTGDGVNDAPAVKEADIGVAMGTGGTDVTREASALVLMDDNFATIVAAVEEGRAIYDNIRKFIRYLLACNTGEVLLMLVSALLGLPLPLLPLQLLLVNLVTDGLPALALGLDPPAADVMRRPPRSPRESVFAGGLGKRIAVRGVLIGGLSLAAFVAVGAAGGSIAAARTAATCTLVLSQLLHAFEARSERRSIWEASFAGNPALLLAVASSLGILATLLYLPAPSRLFGFAPPGPAIWALSAMMAGTGAILSGLIEALRRHWVRRTSLVRVARRRG
jgi:Ca2+-transporting ATPase